MEFVVTHKYRIGEKQLENHPKTRSPDPPKACGWAQFDRVLVLVAPAVGATALPAVAAPTAVAMPATVGAAGPTPLPESGAIGAVPAQPVFPLQGRLLVLLPLVRQV